MKRGDYNRRVAIRRAVPGDDGLSAISASTAEPVLRWAKKTDISDAEKIRAAQMGIEVTSRYLIRSDDTTRHLTSDDIIVDRDVVYAVVGIKEVGGRRVDIEITAVARPYPPDQIP